MGVYQPLLCGLNLVLLCSSTAMLYLGSVLVNFYLLPMMDFYSSNFATVPYLIISIGVMLFFFSIFGFVAVASKNRVVLAVYAGLMGVLFVIQLASIFSSYEFKNELELEEVLSRYNDAVEEDMTRYWSDPDVKAKWDTIQRDFQCCGSAGGFHSGYKDWERAGLKAERLGGREAALPLSCCLSEATNCAGAGTSIFQELRPERRIYVHGCMTILGKRLQRDVLPVLLVYIGCAVLLAVVEMIALVLASAFVASISRKARHSTERLGMYQAPPQLPGPRPLYSDTLQSAQDSGLPSNTGSLRSSRSYRLEAAPPRTPSGSLHRSSLYIEPSSKTDTVI